MIRLKPCEVTSRDWTAVERYLEPHAGLAALLPDICEQVRSEFGPDAELTLDAYSDPEARDEYLTLYLRLPRYEADTLGRLERVSRRFDEKLEPLDGHLLLTTDFRAPQSSQAG